MNNKIVLITGGVKSGKSSLALRYGEEKGERRAFIATATSLDEEMEQKIRAHKKQRGSRWKTFEEPRHIERIIETIEEQFDVIVIDCLTMWISNLLTLYNMTKEAILQESAKLISVLEKSSSQVVLVTNEVSMGIMPGDSVSRLYQELLGRLNRDAGRISTCVYFVVCGIPQKIK